MRTMQWKKVFIGPGKYEVRLGTNLIPGEIIGGRGKWLVWVDNHFMPTTYKTVNDAADFLVRRHIGI